MVYARAPVDSTREGLAIMRMSVVSAPSSAWRRLPGEVSCKCKHTSRQRCCLVAAHRSAERAKLMERQARLLLQARRTRLQIRGLLWGAASAVATCH